MFEQFILWPTTKFLIKVLMIELAVALPLLTIFWLIAFIRVQNVLIGKILSFNSLKLKKVSDEKKAGE